MGWVGLTFVTIRPSTAASNSLNIVADIRNSFESINYQICTHYPTSPTIPIQHTHTIIPSLPSSADVYPNQTHPHSDHHLPIVIEPPLLVHENFHPSSGHRPRLRPRGTESTLRPLTVVQAHPRTGNSLGPQRYENTQR